MIAPAAVAAPIAVPSDYVIGSDDVLSVVFWRDKDLSGDVTVRPDGRISLPLVNELQAAGLAVVGGDQRPRAGLGQQQ